MIIYYTHRYKELKFKSHELLEAAIADYTGDRERAALLVSKLKRDDSHGYEGKPYIEGFDEFSISHSDNSWAVLIGTRACGLDIQYERLCNYRQIARRFFNSEDAGAVEGLHVPGGQSTEDSIAEFFRIWTRREAFTKAIGESVFMEDFPPFAIHTSVMHDDNRYYISNIVLPDSDRLYAAICLEANEDIDEKLIYKEIYVKE